MSWLQIMVQATSDIAELIGDKLIEDTSALSVTFMDAEDTPIFEPLPGEFRLWQDTIIVALYPEDSDVSYISDYLKATQLLPENFLFTAETLQDKAWEREWMDKFHPMQFGEKLWICPSWCELPDEKGIHVMLDPGLAFGTGTHATTALCLDWLEKQDLTGKTLIDFGCGSGILAIAALKLGAKKVIGVDIDPQAIESSQINADRNGVVDALSLYLSADLPANLQVDFVIANILAGPLCELSDNLLSLLPSGGQLAMSGILQSHENSVLDTYTGKLAIEPVVERDGWVRIVGSKV